MSTAATPVLSHEEIIAYHRKGFGVVENLTTPADLERVRELLDGLFDRMDELPRELAFDLGDKKLHAGAKQIPQINNATRFEPRLLETQTYTRAFEAAKLILGSEATFRGDHSIYKPPHNERATPWHQDISYGARHVKNPADLLRWNIAFWIPLQTATIESGCMQFIPFSHLGNILSNHTIGHDPEAHTLETDGVDTARAVACPIALGSATMHAPKTLHYTGPNKTDNPRRAWILNFAVDL